MLDNKSKINQNEEKTQFILTETLLKDVINKVKASVPPLKCYKLDHDRAVYS